MQSSDTLARAKGSAVDVDFHLFVDLDGGFCFGRSSVLAV
jgi:hypothetical protein